MIMTKMMMIMMRMAMTGIPTWIIVAVEGRTETWNRFVVNAQCSHPGTQKWCSQKYNFVFSYLWRKWEVTLTLTHTVPDLTPGQREKCQEQTLVLCNLCPVTTCRWCRGPGGPLADWSPRGPSPWCPACPGGCTGRQCPRRCTGCPWRAGRGSAGPRRNSHCRGHQRSGHIGGSPPFPHRGPAHTRGRTEQWPGPAARHSKELIRELSTALTTALSTALSTTLS